MGDDVRVDVFRQVEPDGHALRAGPHRVVVGDARNPRRQREPHGDRRGRPGGVRSAGQFRRVGRGGERAGIHQALGVNGPETGVHSAGQLIEAVEQVGDKCGRHDESPRGPW